MIASCGRGNSFVERVNGDTITSEAEYMTMIDCGDWVAVEIRAPWSDSLAIGRYGIIRPGSKNVEIAEGYVPIEAPLSQSVVFSSVYTSAIDELGKIEAIKGVADGSYYLENDAVAKLMKDGKIVDVGSSMSPLTEKVVDIEPDAILISPYAGGSSTGVERLGVPLVWMADYLETSPLGRAEWILLLGELYGKADEAREIFETTKRNYEYVKSTVSKAEECPTVIAEKPMSGVWYEPGGRSYIAKMFEDAGAAYPWASNDDSGSISLDEEAVIDKSSDADVWLFKEIKEYSASDLSKELPRARVLKPFPESTYYCNTLDVPYYNVIAFHPDVVLSDMAAIFHPALFPGYELKFYKKLQ